MITHRAELADVPERMAAWCTPATAVVKAMTEISDMLRTEKLCSKKQ